jgi:hypothetical protein
VILQLLGASKVEVADGTLMGMLDILMALQRILRAESRIALFAFVWPMLFLGVLN